MCGTTFFILHGFAENQTVDLQLYWRAIQNYNQYNWLTILYLTYETKSYPGDYEQKAAYTKWNEEEVSTGSPVQNSNQDP